MSFAIFGVTPEGLKRITKKEVTGLMIAFVHDLLACPAIEKKRISLGPPFHTCFEIGPYSVSLTDPYEEHGVETRFLRVNASHGEYLSARLFTKPVFIQRQRVSAAGKIEKSKVRGPIAWEMGTLKLGEWVPGFFAAATNALGMHQPPPPKQPTVTVH